MVGHLPLGRGEGTQNVRVAYIRRVHVLGCPLSRILIVIIDGLVKLLLLGCLFQGVIFTPPLHVQIGGVVFAASHTEHLLRIRTGPLFPRPDGGCGSGGKKVLGEPLDAPGPLPAIGLCYDHKCNNHKGHNESAHNDTGDRRIGRLVATILCLPRSHLCNTPVIGKLFRSHHGTEEVGVSLRIVVAVLLCLLLALDVVNLQVHNDAQVSLQHHQFGVERIPAVLLSHEHLRRVEVVHHGRAISILADLEVGPQNQRQVALEPLLLRLVKLRHVEIEHHVETARQDLVVFRLGLAVQSVPAAGGIVATRIALPISIVVAAVHVVIGIAFQLGALTVSTIKEALFAITGLITFVILEYFPTGQAPGRGIAVLPRIDSQPAVAPIIITHVGVALLVAPVVSRLGLAPIGHTLLPLLIDIDELVASIGPVDPARTRLVRYVAVFASPLGLAGTVVVAHPVDALPMVTGVVGALIPRVLFTGRTRGACRTQTGKVGSVPAVNASTSIPAGRTVTTISSELAVGPTEAGRAATIVAALPVGADAPVLARTALAKVPLGLAMPAHPSRFAHAVVVVDQLDALLAAQCVTGIGQALVHIAFTSGPDKARPALAIIPADFVNAGAAVVAGTLEALIDVDLTQESHGAMRTCAAKVVDEVVTYAAIAARVGFAVVNVVLAVFALVAFGALTLVRADEVFASSPVLARVRSALVHLLLAIASVVSIGTVTLVAVPHVPAVATIGTQLAG